MTHRALHPIVLAGALLGLPAVAALATPRSKDRVSAEIGEVRAPEVMPPAPRPLRATDGNVLIPVEVVESGGRPVRKLVEIQTVPEPSALLLLLPSALLVWRRRR